MPEILRCGTDPARFDEIAANIDVIAKFKLMDLGTDNIILEHPTSRSQRYVVMERADA